MAATTSPTHQGPILAFGGGVGQVGGEQPLSVLMETDILILRAKGHTRLLNILEKARAVKARRKATEVWKIQNILRPISSVRIPNLSDMTRETGKTLDPFMIFWRTCHN